MKPTEREVLERLREEATAWRREAYPGDLLADLRPRLGMKRQRATHWLLGAAAALAMALGARALLRVAAPKQPSWSLSPFQTVSFPSVGAPLRSLSSTPSGFGRAMSAGAGALSALKPPDSSGPAMKEEK